MSHYRHCRYCGNSMPHPTLREAVTGNHECRKCGGMTEMTEWECEYAAQDFQDRFERMEKFLSQWMPKE